MPSSMQRRETIHLSLGPSANAITSHLLNLQGLAATGQGAPCDPNVTHTVSRPIGGNNNNEDFVWVPRVLIVDEPIHFLYFSNEERPTNVPTWSGRVEQISPFTTGNTNNHALVRNTYSTTLDNNASTENSVKDPFELFHQQASILAYSSYSRYQAPSSNSKYSRLDGDDNNNENSRHVNWDDMDDYDDEEDDDEQREFRLRREQQQWIQKTENPIQETLTNFWDTPQEQEQHPPLEQDIPWRMFWMPPYPTHYAIPLPISNWSSGVTSTMTNNSSMVETWDYYVGATRHGWNQWKEDELRESLRRVLEDCDSLQGVTIVTQGHGIYAGLATELLQELQEECRTAGRFVVHVADDLQSRDDCPTDNKENNPAFTLSSTSSSSWQAAQTCRVRNMLQRGLTLHGLASHANLVLPVTLRNNSYHSSSSIFEASARLALALETATLPYRFAPSSGSNNNKYSSKLGLNSYYSGNLTGEFPFGTASYLSFGEYMACLQPSQQYPLLELVACTSPIDNLVHVLQAGTSLERDARMRRPGRSYGEVVLPPGAWMQSDAAKGGVMTSFSPMVGNSATDRSFHHHFALAASLRPSDGGGGNAATSPSQECSLPLVSQHVKSLMEGMGIRYRPEVSVASVLEQNVDQLTSGGYAAGSYWKAACWKDAQRPPPVLSVLGNTSRVYPRLYSIANEAKEALTSIRYRGFYNRDVQNGVLPEREDSEEALSFCFDLRDLYHPPEGSGLGIEPEGSNLYDMDA